MRPKSEQALVALGANLPFEGLEGSALLAAALGRMEAEGLKVVAASSAWETAPWPPSDQPLFYNAVALVDVGAHSPQSLFEVLRGIEARLGRIRRERWGPRTLDLDILDHGGREGVFGGITLPHPRLQERAFVLGPLVELAPAWVHPVLRQTAAELLAALPAGQEASRAGQFWSRKD